MSDILQAARSYYGLADTESCTTQLFTNQTGQTCVAFEIPLSNEDFAAIVQRMQNMQQPDTQPDTAIIEGPTVEAMREAYNALSKAEKGRYGSFARYMQDTSAGIVDVVAPPTDEQTDATHVSSVWFAMSKAEQAAYGHRFGRFVTEYTGGKMKVDDMLTGTRRVVHVDAPEEPEPVSMDAVWIKERDATQAQKLYAIDEKHGPHEPEYLIQWAMLTDEQKKKAKEAGK